MIDPLNPLYPTIPVKRRQQAPRRRDDEHREVERDEEVLDQDAEDAPELTRDEDDQDRKGGHLDEYAVPFGRQDVVSAAGITITSLSPSSASLAAHCLTRGMAGSGRPIKNP